MRPLLTLTLLLLSLCASAQEEFCLDNDLKTLDQAVAQKDKYTQAKQKDINDTKLSLNDCITPIDKYNFYEQLYQKYQKWNPDSARHYAQLCKELALKYEWKPLYIRACIYDVYIQVLCGELLDASSGIQQLGNIKGMSKDNQIKMAILMLEFNIKAKLKNFEDSQTQNFHDAWLSYGAYLPKSDWRNPYYETMLLNKNCLKEILQELKHSQQPSIKVAMLALACSKIYCERKDYNLYLHYLIQSAINDIESANHEASSLLMLINSSHISLDPDRAFNYAMLCTENANVFKDQSRSLEIVKAHAKITKNYQHRILIRNYVLSFFVCLLLVAIIAVGLLLRKNNKKKKEQERLAQQLAESNDSLQAMITKQEITQQQLQTANDNLKEEINYHNQNFFDVYHLVSKYIADVEDFKKLVYNLITAGKYDKARKELHTNAYSDKYLKTFFEHFDQAFLLSHPDFVNRFNKLLRPECHITPPAANMLTPELRIYALVSIGITDSVSIAQFLHYSPQTVYNYRLKVRHSACIEESRFADTVAKMYDTHQTEKGQEAHS